MQPPPPPPPAEASLAELSLSHLKREEAVLTATLTALEENQRALRGGSLEALAAAAAQQAEATRSAEEMKAQRRHFRAQAAALLQVPPEDVTLSALAAHLPPHLAAQLWQSRQRLRQLAGAVDKLNTANAGLLYYCLDFLHRFFRELTGRRATGRYGPGGKPEAAGCGPLLDFRG
jgi:hypothetical protein